MSLGGGGMDLRGSHCRGSQRRVRRVPGIGGRSCLVRWWGWDAGVRGRCGFGARSGAWEEWGIWMGRVGSRGPLR